MPKYLKSLAEMKNYKYPKIDIDVVSLKLDVAQIAEQPSHLLHQFATHNSHKL